MSLQILEPTPRRALLALALALLLAPAAALAQAWPQRQAIKVIVPLSAGSATDIVARVVAEELERKLGQSIVVENRVGAGGAVGTGAAAKAEGRRERHETEGCETAEGHQRTVSEAAKIHAT